MVVRPGSIRPSASAASIIATPMRSLTDPPGLNISSLANSSPGASDSRRVSCTIGVRPTQSAMLTGIRAITPQGNGPSPLTSAVGALGRVAPGGLVVGRLLGAGLVDEL